MTEQKRRAKKVFICSPFSPVEGIEEERKKDFNRNVSQAQLACRFAAIKGCIPHAPHLFFTQFLDDDNQTERKCGQQMGLAWLKSCDELWVIGRRISKGMHLEITKAKEWGIPIKHYVFRRTPQQRALDDVFYPEIDLTK